MKFLFDGILAIIVTILILEFKVPEDAFSSDTQIKSFIHHLVPSFISYVISFAIIISLWINHHDLFRHIKSADIRFVMLNFLFILFLSPIPFTTALAGRNYESSYAVALVATNYFLMNLTFAFIWAYATRKKIIPEAISGTKFFKRNVIISLIAGLLLMISIPFAYISTYISFSLFITVIILHIGKEFFY